MVWPMTTEKTRNALKFTRMCKRLGLIVATVVHMSFKIFLSDSGRGESIMNV